MVMKHLTWFSLVRTIVLSLALGATGGVLATSLTSSYLSDYALSLNQITQSFQKESSVPKTFPNSYADASGRFMSEVTPSFATLYPKNPKGAYGYTADEIIKTGVVVTQDGWIAVHHAPVLNANQLLVEVDKQLYTPVQIVTDPVIDIAFIKLQANGLPVVDFGKGLDLSLQQQTFVSDTKSSLIGLSVIKEVWPQGAISFSDVVSHRFVLDDSVAPWGSSVFDLGGRLVGFVEKKDGETRVMPIEMMLPALQSLLEQKNIVRPTLGVQYVDLSRGVGVSEKMRRGLRTGAYITGRPAIKKGGAAAAAGLFEGDVILSVNGINLSEQTSLDALIVNMKPKEQISLSIDRLGEKKNITAILGE